MNSALAAGWEFKTCSSSVRTTHRWLGFLVDRHSYPDGSMERMIIPALLNREQTFSSSFPFPFHPLNPIISRAQNRPLLHTELIHVQLILL